ncbi:MAG: 4-hydroxy-tetrahydrodipicolinate synthase [Bdellovibrionales bacterium RIFOXYD1_FULL_53_11]|nr:MAG: 4-hydroxy-tetrahydrodipicolinate synthase [Bdellovibrionales bacterium RIFOXYD1_FULL_53_11]
MKGVWTAVVTPFEENGGIDINAFRKILHDQADAGVAGVVVGGTTGEAPALTNEEKKTLVQAAIKELGGGGAGVVAGTGTNNTRDSVEFSKWASDAGCSGVLVVTPYYNKPSQTGLEAHFTAVADAVSCEVILYNVPGRTGISITAETVMRLSAHPRIRTLKEATGNVAFTSEILDALSLAGRRMDVLSGDDATFLPLLSVGAAGVISVASNLFPRAMVGLYKAFIEGRTQEALEIHARYYPLFRDLFVESNPVPVKYAMAHARWCRPDPRAPLAPLSEESVRKLQASLDRAGIRKGMKA